MRCIGYQPQDHARHWISKYSKIKIPIPPLTIQKEIVKILDNFTQLETELETAGFGERRLLGAFDQRPFEALESRDLIVVAR